MTREVPPRILFVAVLTALGAVLSADDDVKFISTFKSIDAGAVSFTGKKVAAMVISDDMSLRLPVEDALARELSNRGMQGVATYRIAPKEELAGPERAKPWFEKNKIDGVVALRPVSVTTRTDSTPGIWSSGPYSTFWGYYGYGWTHTYAYIPLGGRQTETKVRVENTIYSVPRDALMWAALVEVTNPRNLPSFLGEIVTETVKEMQKQGLAKAQAK